MTNTTAPYEAECIAPLGDTVTATPRNGIVFKQELSCPLPLRLEGTEPVFCADFRAQVQDRYFLTISYADGSTHGISLMVARTGPAKPRIEDWLSENLPGARLEDWYMQEIEKPGSFKGVTGLMTMEVA